MNDFFKIHSKHFDFKLFIQSALAEDIGSGDYTSIGTIPENKSGKMKLLVKEEGVIAGVEALEKMFLFIDKKIKVQILIKDGLEVKSGDIVLTAEGNFRKLLISERLILNVIQRMSGIATKTNRIQKLIGVTGAKLCDTRKTTPGFRFFEKWAVSIGGGSNHRFGLYDMILIKDNHVDIAGGIIPAIKAANIYLKKKKLKIPIEIETRNLTEVEQAIKFGNFQRIMLDNFSISETKMAVKLIAKKFEIESSGGIDEKNILKYAQCGVNFISMGSLTHHIKSLDLSLKVFSY